MKVTLFAVFIGLQCATLSAKTIELGTSTTVETYFPGISSAVVEAFKMAGHQVNKLLLPGERAIVMFKTSELDAEIMRLATFDEIVSDAIPVNVVLTNLELVAMVRKRSGFETIDDLIGKRMAAERGTRVQMMVAEKMNATLVQQQSIEATFKMMSAERVDFVAVTRDIGQQLIDQGYDVRLIDKPLLTIPFYVWLTKENADLLPDIEKNLNILKAEGRF
ncbi:ABC transporter substrate-binding protein [Reinekea sp. G2M2-21]|uniref:substrate-binding periplasmic protein n=1 Tax=Reinekea sp. G2M2-21 TaxID=2788942 RepID=UPI0018A8A9F2|nr:transporter substrate-binding domain-containing protein [Reinekea sp. G2M2-21]